MINAPTKQQREHMKKIADGERQPHIVKVLREPHPLSHPVEGREFYLYFRIPKTKLILEGSDISVTRCFSNFYDAVYHAIQNDPRSETFDFRVIEIDFSNVLKQAYREGFLIEKRENILDAFKKFQDIGQQVTSIDAKTQLSL